MTYECNVIFFVLMQNTFGEQYTSLIHTSIEFRLIPIVKLFFKIGKRFNSHVPLVYVLSSKKDAETFGTIFNEIKKLKPGLNPKHIMIDFEQATMREAGKAFPEAQIHGCFFHFSQCIWRKIQQCRLASKYSEDAEFAMEMRYFASLAFLPSEKVIESFSAIKGFMKMERRPRVNTTEHQIWQVCDYVEKTWVGTKKKEPLFPIAMWNMRQLTLDGTPRTNNAVEGWHNAISRGFGCSNPSVWTFIDKLKAEQDRHEVRMAQITANDGEVLKRKYLDHGKNIFNVVKAHQLKPTGFSLREFLSRLAHNLRY